MAVKMYAACYNYAGAHAIFTTLEKAIEEMAEYCDYIEEWPVDQYIRAGTAPVVWERDWNKPR